MNSGPVVSDTTPLINLAGIGLLDLLPRLYGTIWIPRAVADEFQAKASAADPDLTQFAWLTIVDAVALDSLLPKLGAGETAAISLAKSVPARFILLDERKARRIALAQGLIVVGTLAALLRAKDQALIPAIKPHIEAMEAQGRYFGEALIAQILQAAGE
jgi:uncharacterized protein